MSKSALKSAKATKKAAKSFAKWTEKGSNSAIDDVMQKVSQVMQLHADSQAQFAKDYELCLQNLHKVGQTELQMKTPLKQLKKARAHERKQQNKIRKLMDNDGYTTLLDRSQLDQAVLTRESAEQNLTKKRAETEVTKMQQFREAMMDIADAQGVLATKTVNVFNYQKKIAQFVPVVSTQNVSQVMYEGAVYTQKHVDELRQLMKLSNSPYASPGPGIGCTRPDAQLVVNKSEDTPPTYSSTQPILHAYTPLQSNSHAEDGRAKQTSTNGFPPNMKKRT
uniref:Uncharacterized protein n=1 Tax=Ditylenchus dipsaci TaxID=166011 RepID=A0A915E5D4_9BILA